jgi:osmotically-inducible protein OsmY
MPDDMTLQAMVMDDELAWAPNVDAAHVGVAAQNDVVSLSGSLAEKVAASQAAPQVKGIPGIAQKIVVRPPSAHHHADEEIADRARKILNWDLEVPDEHIGIKVENGVVTLSGAVNSREQPWSAISEWRDRHRQSDRDTPERRSGHRSCCTAPHDRNRASAQC